MESKNSKSTASSHAHAFTFTDLLYPGIQDIIEVTIKWTYFRFTPVFLRRLPNAGLDPTWISKKTRARDMGDNGPGHVPAGSITCRTGSATVLTPSRTRRGGGPGESNVAAAIVPAIEGYGVEDIYLC